MMNTTISSNTNWNSTPPASTKSPSLCFMNDPTSIKTAKVFFYIIIFIASLIGNTLILYAVTKKATLRRSINQFIGNVCLANLLITVVYMPRMMVMVVHGSHWAVKGTLGLVLCKVVPVIHHACLLVSILSLTALSIDRFFYIVVPTKQILSKKQQKFVIPLMWAVAVLVRFPSLYALRLIPTKNDSVICGGNIQKAFKSTKARETYYTFLLVFFYALPLILIVMFYSIIIVFLKNRKRLSSNRYKVDGTVKAKYKQASRKTLKMLITVTVCFVICWATYFLAQIAYTSVPCELRFWRFFLAHCNSAISPYLCMIFNKKYQEQVKDALYRSCCLCCAVCEIPEEDVTEV